MTRSHLQGVQGCPCARMHLMTPEELTMFSIIAGGKPALIPVVSHHGTWNVPSIYVACHVFGPDDLPELAQQYGWRRA